MFSPSICPSFEEGFGDNVPLSKMQNTSFALPYLRPLFLLQKDTSVYSLRKHQNFSYMQNNACSRFWTLQLLCLALGGIRGKSGVGNLASGVH